MEHFLLFAPKLTKMPRIKLSPLNLSVNFLVCFVRVRAAEYFAGMTYTCNLIVSHSSPRDKICRFCGIVLCELATHNNSIMARMKKKNTKNDSI